MPIVGPSPSPNTDAPQQRSQPSRKGKRAWRKNVDLTDVVKGLEELNDEIIHGGVIKERESDALFVIDLVGSKGSERSKHKPLKADEIIAQRSKFPAVPTRKRPGDKTVDGVLPSKRIRADWVSHKELARLRMVADGHHDHTVDLFDAGYDVWAEKSEPPPTDTVARTLVLAQQQAKIPSTMREPPISLSADGKPVPAVPKPSGGYSYNPSYLDYEQRFEEESRKAIETEKKRLEAEEAESLVKEAVARSAAEAEAAEQRAELSEWDDDSAWEGFESGREDAVGNKKRPERKTQAQRNRIRRRKEEERLRKHEAAVKAKEVQFLRIKQLAQEVAKERERSLTLPQDLDSETPGNDINLRKRQLGKFRLPEKDLELVLPDELQDSLRLLKPEGNLLKERYRSFLVRGKMESRRHLPFKKQAKTKLTEKWTYKDFTLW